MGLAVGRGMVKAPARPVRPDSSVVQPEVNRDNQDQ